MFDQISSAYRSIYPFANTRKKRPPAALMFVLVAAIACTTVLHAGRALAQQNPLTFQEKSNILGGQNLARTKDADIADVNGDGFLDILDGNSNNSDRGTDVILRLNDRAGRFRVSRIGPRDNAVSYDSDLVDLNNDDLPDLIRTQSFSRTNNQIAVFYNRGGVSNQWFVLDQPDFTALLTNCPDDIAFGDLDNDSDTDFAVTQRLFGKCGGGNGTSTTSVFLNNGNGSNFTRIAELPAPTNRSTHDAFFIDADNDGNLDIFSVNESGNNSGRLWLSNGRPTPGYTLSSLMFNTAYAGSAADFNNDGLEDFVLGGDDVVTVYLNGPTPGQFTPSNLTNVDGAGSFYDLELGDVDVDGDIDIIGVTISDEVGQVRIWLNNGQGSFTAFGGTNPLPGHVDNQRLSADLIDYDQDGDLDLYVTGGDGSRNRCSGCVPNQFFENLLVDARLTISNRVLPVGDPGRFRLSLDGVLRAGGVKTEIVRLASTPGPHTLASSPGSGTSASDYRTIIGGDCSEDGTVTLVNQGKQFCLVTHLARSGEAACDKACFTDLEGCKKEGVFTPRQCVQISKACLSLCDQQPDEQLSVRAEVVPPSAPGRFNLLIDGVTRAANVGNGGVGSQNVDVGLHLVEALPASGTSAADYRMEISRPCAADGTILIAGGEQKTCVVTATGARIDVRLIVKPFTNAGRFNLRIDGSTRLANAGSGSRTGELFVQPGMHRVSQTGAAGTRLGDYTASFSGDCDRNGRVTLARGALATCTITNRAKTDDGSCLKACKLDQEVCKQDDFNTPRFCAQEFLRCKADCPRVP